MNSLEIWNGLVSYKYDFARPGPSSLVAQPDIQAVIPPKANRVEQSEYDRHVYKDRNLVERFFNRLKQFRRIATRYEKLARNFFGMLSLACAYIWMA